ncbi:MAG: TMEM165/GDT1 family protein [Candidatus Krumholzibacteriota bacterium]|nr:TMEM165/GDT1 family protein [Candidatus Krumholzibacteriota bacterium]
MEMKIFFTVFWTVLVAELGDKTQLATLLFASDKDTHKWSVFAGASLALLATSALAVFFGSLLSNYLSPKVMSIIAGAGFILIGILILTRGVSGN